MRHKTFDKPHSHDKDWYSTREMADHINQPEHRPRLMQALEYVNEVLLNHPDFTICDFGCGNGGLIREIEKKI